MISKCRVIENTRSEDQPLTASKSIRRRRSEALSSSPNQLPSRASCSCDSWVATEMLGVKDGSTECSKTSSSIWKVVVRLEFSYVILRISASCRRCSSIRAERIERKTRWMLYGQVSQVEPTRRRYPKRTMWGDLSMKFPKGNRSLLLEEKKEEFWSTNSEFITAIFMMPRTVPPLGISASMLQYAINREPHQSLLRNMLHLFLRFSAAIDGKYHASYHLDKRFGSTMPHKPPCDLKFEMIRKRVVMSICATHNVEHLWLVSA